MGGALGQSHPCHAPGGRTWLKNFITRTLYTVHSIGQEGEVCTGGALGCTYNVVNIPIYNDAVIVIDPSIPPLSTHPLISPPIPPSLSSNSHSLSSNPLLSTPVPSVRVILDPMYLGACVWKCIPWHQ